MGLPMAGHLLRAGFEVRAYNRTAFRAEPLAAEGAVLVDSPAAATQDAEAVITIVSDTPDVQSVYLGPDGVCAALALLGVVVIVDATRIGAATSSNDPVGPKALPFP